MVSIRKIAVTSLSSLILFSGMLPELCSDSGSVLFPGNEVFAKSFTEIPERVCKPDCCVDSDDVASKCIDYPATTVSEVTEVSKKELAKVRNAFIETTLVSYSPSDEVTRHYMGYSENGRAAIDVLLMQLYLSVQLPPDEVSRVMEQFDFGKRQWKDIDYTDMSRGGWDMTLHITRIYALAKSYKWPQSPFYNDAKLGELLHKASGWWFDNMPVNPNWWHNDIGVPKKLSAAMILLRDELSESELAGALKVLERSRFGRTGQNKAWLAGNQLMKALLIDDPELAAEAKRQIAEEIYVTEDEGIQPDWSFHQHGPQLQFGNYGLAFAEGVSFWIRVLNGTAYAFSEPQVEIMENFILNGLCWTLWKGLMDPSACGRQLHIDGGRGKAYSCAVAAFNMAALGRPKSRIFEQVALQNLQPEMYENELVGATYYPRSDFGIYRTKDWYASIRMQSERTIGYEFTNSENQLAQFSADGALLLMQSGEEYENIFPYWDWRMLPGVTAYYDGKPFLTSDKRQDKQNNSSHVGGLTAGEFMVTTIEVDRNGLHAFKSDFFLGDIIVSLGSDICSSRDDIERVTTALDQNHLVQKKNGEPEVYKGSFRSRKSMNTDWAWHDGRGYVLLDDARLNVDTQLQSGSWSKMAPMYTKADTGKVFKAWVEHPVREESHYAYALLPCRDLTSTKAFAKSVAKSVAAYTRSCPAASSSESAADASDEWKSAVRVLEKYNDVPVVLRNDDCCQAVAYKGNVYAVVHKAGIYNLCGSVRTFSEPVLYMNIGGETFEKSLPTAN